MKSQRCFAIGACLILGAAFLFAKEIWEGPFGQWTQKDVVKILTDSPWAVSQTTTSANISKSAGRAGENETYYKFTASIFSALPVRQAFVRMSRIRNNYDAMNEEQKQAFDAKFNKPLTLDFSETIAVALEYSSTPTDANFIRDMKNFLDQATAETLKQNVYLITKGSGRVDLKEYYPPGRMLPAATFVFPRTVNGKPVVTAEDKELRLQVGWVPGGGQLFIVFKPQKMIVNGQLAL